MDTTYRFSLRKRAKGAVWPFGVALALAALTIAFTTPGRWTFWVGWTFVAIALFRGALYLYYASRTLQIDATGITRSGTTVPYNGAELELRLTERANALHVSELILWGPRDAEGKRSGVGFDDSLDQFDRAVRTVVAKVPEMRIVLSMLGEPNITDDRREQVLAPLRPTPAERALNELGRSKLSVPPHLRN